MKYKAVAVVLLLAGCSAFSQPSDNDQRVAIDSFYVLAEVALENGETEEAARLLVQAAELSSNPQLAERATRLAEETGRTEYGLRAVSRWAQLAPMDDRPTWFRGLFNTRSGLYDEAVDDFMAVVDGLPADSIGSGLALVFEALANEPNSGAGTYIMRELVEAYPGYAAGHYALARLALRSGNFDLCLEHAKEATRIEPDWLDAQLLLARSLLVGGNTQESLTLIAELAQQNPAPEVRLQQAELLLSAGRGDQAETILNEIVAADPEMIEAIRALAFLRLAEDDLDAAQQHFERLRNSEPYRNEAFYYLGRIAETKGSQLQATRSYARVIEGSHVVEAQLRIARIMYEQTGDENTALEHLEEFGNENTMFATDMIVARSEILLQSGQVDAAMKLISDSLAESPSDVSLQQAHVQLFVNMAQAASNERDYDTAGDILDDALDLYPGNITLRYSLSLLYEDQGRMRRAASTLKALVEEQPDNPALLNAYGYLLTDQYERHAEAQEFISRALAMDPDNPAIIDSMGWVLYKLGDYRAALDYLERAYRLYNDPEVIAHLIDTQWMLGDRQSALELLEKGLAEFPESRHLIEVNDRLTQ